MSTPKTIAEPMFEVVKNDEGQYSIWPAEKAIPAGWGAVGVREPKAACLSHINAVWTDMRPQSLIAQMGR